MKRDHYFSGTKWEPIVGYSRAVKFGNHIHISGSTATNDEGEIVGINKPAKQTKQTIENIKSALNHFGADLDSVVRTRMYVVNIDDWEKIGKIHGDYFSDINPATSMVEVQSLIEPEMLVEIEAEAYYDGQ